MAYAVPSAWFALFYTNWVSWTIRHRLRFPQFGRMQTLDTVFILGIAAALVIAAYLNHRPLDRPRVRVVAQVAVIAAFVLAWRAALVALLGS